DRALPHRVVALGVDWAPFVVKDLVALIQQLIILLTTQGAIHITSGLRLRAESRWLLGPPWSLWCFPLLSLLRRGKRLRSCSSSSAQHCIMSRSTTTVFGV